MSSQYLNDEARRYIEGIRATKNKMEAEFEDFNATMQQLASGNAFVGSAGNSFFDKYNSLKKEYEYFERLFDSFAKDFELSVEATEATNRAVEQAASQISDVEK